MSPIGFEDLQVMENYSSSLLVSGENAHFPVYIWGVSGGRPNELVASNEVQSCEYHISKYV